MFSQIMKQKRKNNNTNLIKFLTASTTMMVGKTTTRQSQWKTGEMKGEETCCWKVSEVSRQCKLAK